MLQTVNSVIAGLMQGIYLSIEIVCVGLKAMVVVK